MVRLRLQAVVLQRRLCTDSNAFACALVQNSPTCNSQLPLANTIAHCPHAPTECASGYNDGKVTNDTLGPRCYDRWCVRLMIRVRFRNDYLLMHFANQELSRGQAHLWLPNILQEADDAEGDIVTIAGCQSTLLYEYEKFEAGENNNDLR